MFLFELDLLMIVMYCLVDSVNDMLCMMFLVFLFCVKFMCRFCIVRCFCGFLFVGDDVVVSLVMFMLFVFFEIVLDMGVDCGCGECEYEDD